MDIIQNHHMMTMQSKKNQEGHKIIQL